MKKLKNYYFAAMAIASLGFLTSCGGDDEPNPKAVIGLTPSQTEITAAPGEQLNVEIQVTSADKLKEFKVMKTTTGATQEVVRVTSFPGSGHNYTLNETIPASAVDGTIISYTVTATTSKDEVTERVINVTVESFDAFTATIMGNQNASAGSFFSTSNGQVMTSAQANANSALVDLVYYYSVGGTAAADMATLAAPTEAVAQAVYGASSTANIPSWSTKNATKFKSMGTTATAFDNAGSGSAVATAYTNSPATEGAKVTQLVAGSVFGFMTANNKHGIAKVTSVTLPTTANNNSSEIRLDIKMQR